MKIAKGEGEWLLPQPITQRILSYLSAKDAARTSLVSTDLYSAWSTNPILKFDFDEEVDKEDEKLYNPQNGLPVILDEESEKFKNYVKGRGEFFNSAIKSLQRYRNHKLCVQQLHLSMRCCSWPDPCDFIVKLLDNIEKDEPPIKEVHVSYTQCWRGRNKLSELFRILQVKALKDLNVKGLFSLSSIPKLGGGDIECCLLRRLVLEGADIIDVSTLESLFLRCPLIESLKLLQCRGNGLNRIKVANLPCLKECIIYNTSCWNIFVEPEVEVEAPNLESLLCEDPKHVVYLRFKLHPCPNLKFLSMSDLLIDDSFFQNLADKFPKMEDLSVQRCHGYKKINLSSNSLKYLSLIGGGEALEEDEINISAPGLVSFEYEGRCIPRFNSSASKCKCKFWLSVDRQHFDASWIIQLRKTLSQFIDPTVALDIYLDLEGLGYNEKLGYSREDIEPKAPVENLIIGIYEYFGTYPSAYSTLVDNLFWCCQPKIICIFWTKVCNREFLKYLCSRLINRSDPHKGNSGECKYSWEKDLKEAEIQTFDGEDEKEKQPFPVDWRIFVNKPYPSKPKMTIFRLEWHKEPQAGTSI